MKTGKPKLLPLAMLFSVFFSANSNAVNYYLSAAGNNTNSGTSASLPWQSLSALSSVVFSAGDTVFLRCGDVFRGSITINQGGLNVNNRLVFTSYGTGAKPVISGALAVSNWTMAGPATYGTIYHASFTQNPTMFFTNNRERILARYPNDHRYLTLNSSTLTNLVDNSLASIGTATINNSKICIHTRQWCWEKTGVASVNGNTITFTSPVLLTGLPQYGYFLYDNILHLDTIGEWKYDATAQRINFVATSSQPPTGFTCEASVSTYSNGISFGSNVSYVSILNLAFEKQANAAISINNTNNRYIKIENCSFARQYNYGVNDRGRYNEVSNCYFREVDGLAVSLEASARKAIIHHNTFRNNGEFRNSGIGLQYNLTSIHNSFADSCYIHHNTIDSAGYCGISCDGAHNTVERNSIKNAMLCNNDGAAIKCFGAGSFDNIIQNNIIYNSNGNREGTFNGDFSTPGIYCDFNAHNNFIRYNTITEHTGRGIFQNSGNYGSQITYNVVYGAENGVDLNGTQATTTSISGMVIKRNSFFALSSSAHIIKQIDGINNYTVSQGYIDSNYCFQPYNSANIGFRMLNNTTATPYNFAAWQALGFDLKSKKSFVSWTLPVNNSSVFINASDNISTVNLSGLWLTLDSTEVCGSFSLQPYTSRILINPSKNCITGLNKQEAESFLLVFPNPASDRIVIKALAGKEILSLDLFDINGRKVLEVQETKTEKEIRVDGLPNGIYLLRVQTTNGINKVEKVVINH